MNSKNRALMQAISLILIYVNKACKMLGVDRMYSLSYPHDRSEVTLYDYKQGWIASFSVKD